MKKHGVTINEVADQWPLRTDALQWNNPIQVGSSNGDIGCDEFGRSWPSDYMAHYTKGADATVDHSLKVDLQARSAESETGHMRRVIVEQGIKIDRLRAELALARNQASAAKVNAAYGFTVEARLARIEKMLGL